MTKTTKNEVKRTDFIKGILGKFKYDPDNPLTQEEQNYILTIFTKEIDKAEKAEKAKAEKVAKNEKILEAMEKMLDKQGQFTASEIFEALNGEYTIQRVSYVARELAPVVAVDNPLYAVKVYKRA